MRGFIIRLLVNAAALAVAAFLLPGIDYGSATDLLLVALVFGIVNALIKPIVTLLTCPLVLLTLGLFTLVINALMLLLTNAISGVLKLNFTVEGFATAFVGGLIITLVSFALNALIKD